jgi:hypothetical protein
VGKSQRVIDQVQQFLRDNQRTTRLEEWNKIYYNILLNRNLDVFKQRLEVLQTNMRWMQRNFGKLSQWFRSVHLSSQTFFIPNYFILRDHNDERQQPLPFDEMELNGPLPSPIARRKKSANN